MYIGLYVKYRCYSCRVLMKLEFSRQIFEKYSNVNLKENPSIGSRVVLCGTTEGGAEDKHDERNFANVPPKKNHFYEHSRRTVRVNNV